MILLIQEVASSAVLGFLLTILSTINHANDYLARVYAQTLLRTLQDKDVPSDEGNGAENKTKKGGCGSTASISGAGIALGLAVAATAKKRQQ